MSDASLDFVIEEFCVWFDNRIEYAKKLKSEVFGNDRPHKDTNLMCTFFYQGDAIVDGQVCNAWCDYKYTYGSQFPGDGSYDNESIYVDLFEHGVQILFEQSIYLIDFSSFSTEPTEAEVFQFSTVCDFEPLNETQLLKLVRRAKQLQITPPDEREYTLG